MYSSVRMLGQKPMLLPLTVNSFRAGCRPPPTSSRCIHFRPRSLVQSCIEDQRSQGDLLVGQLLSLSIKIIPCFIHGPIGSPVSPWLISPFLAAKPSHQI